MYVSHVIDDLQAEVAAKIDAVTEYLARAIRRADSSATWLPVRSEAALNNGARPTAIVVPSFDHKAHLGAWHRTLWSAYSPERRDAVSRRNDRLQMAQVAFTAKWDQKVAERDDQIAKYDAKLDAEREARQQHNEEWRERVSRAESGDREAQWELFEARFESFMEGLDLLPGNFRMTYSPDSKRAVVEAGIPTKDVIPLEKSVRFLKTTGEHRYTFRSEAELKRLYTGFVSQAVLGVTNAMFKLSYPTLIETVGMNAVVRAPDPATGELLDVIVVSLVTSREVFETLRLSDVDPVACLRHLSAAVSRSPAEVIPVRPIVRLDTSDVRFVGESDLLSELDSRPNLMDLSPNEFESLVQNLFSKMGLDTRQTRPSRDGGVDAVAFDPRPVLGGKIVIQAKRYKGTVGVSAVRDLFGTLQNEGASKGILVTTSGYGSASFEFAKNKPIELIDGAGLLYLLNEHAGVDARIVMPDDWVDPRPEGA